MEEENGRRGWECVWEGEKGEGKEGIEGKDIDEGKENEGE